MASCSTGTTFLLPVTALSSSSSFATPTSSSPSFVSTHKLIKTELVLSHNGGGGTDPSLGHAHASLRTEDDYDESESRLEEEEEEDGDCVSPTSKASDTGLCLWIS